MVQISQTNSKITSKRMYHPNFRITNRILNNLTEIASAREVTLNAHLVPKWEVALRREALIKSTHSSTSIEGNPLTLKEVSELAAGRKVMATRKDKQEVLNYLHVLDKISEFVKDNRITKEDVLKLHHRITKDTLENLGDSGVYRNRQVVVGNRFTGEVIFRPPDTRDVPRLMKELVEWLNSKGVQELNPVLVAGISHYEFVRIHPFIDGNGRTARVLATMILYLKGFDTKRFFTLDDYYDSDRAAYYKALRSVNQKTLDLTGWLEYFTEGVTLSVAKVKERILRLSSERLRRDKKGQIALTERQMRLVERIIDQGRITNREIREMFHISNRAAMDEISKLLKLNVIKSVGKGRSVHYVLE